MTVSNYEYAVLSAWANSQMFGLLGGGGQDFHNFTAPASLGWSAQVVTLSDIQSAITAAGGTGSNLTEVSSLGAFLFTKIDSAGHITDTVISYRGTQSFDEGTAIGLGDWITNASLSSPTFNGTLSYAPQVMDAYYFYLASLAKLSVLDPAFDPANGGLSFTGHSLGGAMASIIGLYTNNSFTVFDPAPNQSVAESFFQSVYLDNRVSFTKLPAGSSTDLDNTLATLSMTKIVTEGDPIDSIIGGVGDTSSDTDVEGRLGETIRLHLNFDHDVFTTTPNDALNIPYNALFGNGTAAISICRTKFTLQTSWVLSISLSPGICDRLLADFEGGVS